MSLVCDSDAWGGAEVYLTHLLRRAPQHGWSASLVCAEPVVGRLTRLAPVDGVAVVPVARHAEESPAVRAALAAQRPEVVLVNLVDPGSNAAAVGAALDVAPTVGVLHLAGDTGTGQRRALLAARYAAMAAVLTPASEIRSQVVADFQLAAERVVVVPNGVDVPPDPAGPAGHAAPRIGGLGRLTAQKGFDVLVEATRLLVRDGVALDVVIGGTGRDAATLHAAAAGLPVSFCGFIDAPRRFLAGLDLFCLPSRQEALPLALLEAMAEGLPCVTTDVGDVRAEAGRAAVVVPPEDPVALAAAIRPLIAEPPRRLTLGRLARRRAEEAFDADRMARHTFAVLDSVRRGAGSSAGERDGTDG